MLNNILLRQVQNSFLSKEMFFELFRYGIVGVSTTILNIGTYRFFSKILDFHYIIATILAWIMAVVYAFFMNKFVVFKEKDGTIIKEFVSFITVRGGTGLLDVIVMYIGVSAIGINDIFVKVFSNIIGISLNYILGKFFVFKKY